MSTAPNNGGCSAYQAAFGSNPADLYFWEDNDRGPDFVQHTSVSGKFTLQWELRLLAQGAILKWMAGSKLRRIWDSNHTFDGTDVAIGVYRIFYK